MTAPLVHTNPSRDLTLSEAPERSDARDGGQVSTGRAHSPVNITADLDPLAAIAEAIAAHLSPRAGSALASWDSPGALETRTAFVVQAIAAAARCPICPVELGEAVRHG